MEGIPFNKFESERNSKIYKESPAKKGPSEHPEPVRESKGSLVSFTTVLRHCGRNTGPLKSIPKPMAGPTRVKQWLCSLFQNQDNSHSNMKLSPYVFTYSTKYTLCFVNYNSDIL